LKIINPNLQIQDQRNIFTLRKNDYEQILPTVSEIVKPVTELGFEILELDIKESRFTSGELSKTIKQTLVIKIQKGTSVIDLSMFIPKLIDDNYIMINGRRKIPLFQLFDIPVVTRGESIKLRTNVATMIVYKDKEAPNLKVSFLGKKLHLGLMLFAYYGPDTVINRFNLRNVNINPESKVLYENLISDLQYFEEESKGYTQDEFIHEVGRTYSRYNAKSKGEDVMYALDLIPKVDVLTTKFLQTGSIVEELLLAIKEESIDDTLFTNKRVRCFEYMIYSKVSKMIFDLCYSNRTTRTPKFNINSTQILTECNVSDIVQFDFSINPIEELTKLSRISLLGPGGFKRENIPKHLRDICPSMFKRICPVDTPDRDNCGVLQNLIPNIKLEDNLRFSPEITDSPPISIPVSMVPFCEHDDQTRLQMASSQMRQSIMLKSFDEPMIKSGSEALFMDYTQFIKRAKKNGEVIHIDQKYLIVVYEDSEVDIFDIEFRKIYVEHLDFLNVYVKPGDKFKAGQILAESNYSKNGEIIFGKNLLTGVTIYYGFNYEDGIVISDRLVKEDVFTSVHFEDLSFTIPPYKVLLSLEQDVYKPLPNEFDTVKRGQAYAIMKSLSAEDLYSVFGENQVLEADKRFVIPEVKVYANNWNEDIPEYNEWMLKTIQKQEEKEKYLQSILKEKLPKEEALKCIRDHSLDLFSFTGKYKEKREKINGVYVQMTGIHFRKIQVGDKIANRHGNKGVISKIISHDKMPQIEDGRHLDICINPLGIISRINLGQLFELRMSMILEDLKKDLSALIENNLVSQDEVKQFLLGFIKIIDKTDGWYYKQFEEQLPETIDQDFINQLTLIQPPFKSCTIEDVEKAAAYTNTKFKQEVYDPLSKTKFLNKIAVGYIYFFRMVHIAAEKLAARGIGSYAKRTLQPLGGRKNKGGQRCGEMETACIIGHDAPCNLFEFLTTKSDCIDLKNRYIRNFIDSNLVDESKELDTRPESVKLLNAYLTVLGVDYK
jgi:DNA-directed RNA polymerase beta subunit